MSSVYEAGKVLGGSRAVMSGDAITGIGHEDGSYFNGDFGVTFSVYWEKSFILVHKGT